MNEGAPGTERLLSTFLDLVRIDSPSGSESGVARFCQETLEHVGFSVTVDGSQERTGSDTGNLVAFLESPSSPATLVLSAHMDCVQPCEGVEPVVVDGVVSSAGDTVLGADDKVGIAVIIEACRRLVESGGERPSLRVVFTVSEEIGLKGAKALDPPEVHGDLCLVLDADGEPGGIVIGAPTHYTFAAAFMGTAAHAGVAPEQGRSAVLMAARAIAAMSLGRLDDETTANIGSIAGGSATNVVPAFAQVTGECRSLDPDKVERVRQSMDEAMREAARVGGGSVQIGWTKEYTGYRFAEDDPLLTIVRGACADTGVEPRLFATGGGSDANIFSALGVPAVALSSGMRDVHTTSESVTVDAMEVLTRLVIGVARRLAGQ